MILCFSKSVSRRRENYILQTFENATEEFKIFSPYRMLSNIEFIFAAGAFGSCSIIYIIKNISNLKTPTVTFSYYLQEPPSLGLQDVTRLKVLQNLP